MRPVMKPVLLAIPLLPLATSAATVSTNGAARGAGQTLRQPHPFRMKSPFGEPQ